MTACVSNELNMHAEVTNERIVGFNVDPDKIAFGTLSPGTMSTRQITINSSTLGCIQLKGELADWVTTKPKCFKRDEQINVTARIPITAKEGNYTGKLLVRLI